jgi:hypothetical protein
VAANPLPIKRTNGQWSVTLPDGTTQVVATENDAQVIALLKILEQRVLEATRCSGSLHVDLEAAIEVCERNGRQSDVSHLEGLIRHLEALPGRADPDWDDRV